MRNVVLALIIALSMCFGSYAEEPLYLLNDPVLIASGNFDIHAVAALNLDEAGYGLLQLLDEDLDGVIEGIDGLYVVYDGVGLQVYPVTGTGAPDSATYIVASLHAGLTSERVLAVATGLQLTDGGANGNMTLTPINDLGALEGLASTGIVVRSGSETFTVRALSAPAAGLTISNNDGVAANPTFALANDLAALEGLSTNGIPQRTGADTWVILTDFKWDASTDKFELDTVGITESSGTLTFDENDDLRFNGSGFGATFLQAAVTGDAEHRFEALYGGQLGWGPGGTDIIDTYLGRTDIGELTITRDLNLGQALSNIQAGDANVKRTITLAIDEAQSGTAQAQLSPSNWDQYTFISQADAVDTSQTWFVPMPDDWDGTSIDVYLSGRGAAAIAGTFTVRWDVTARVVAAADVTDLAGTTASVTHTLSASEGSHQVSPVITVAPNGTTTGSQLWLLVRAKRDGDHATLDSYTNIFFLTGATVEYASDSYGH